MSEFFYICKPEVTPLVTYYHTSEDVAKGGYSQLLTMELPPGLVYIFGHIPRVFIYSVATYTGLYILQDRQIIPNLPSGATILAAILARPIIFVAHRYISLWENRRAAAANGAIIAPFVNKSPLAIIAEVVEAIRDGYPGELVFVSDHITTICSRFFYFDPLQRKPYSDGPENMEMWFNSISSRIQLCVFCIMLKLRLPAHRIFASPR